MKLYAGARILVTCEERLEECRRKFGIYRAMGDLTTRGKNVCCTREILKSAFMIENRNGSLLVNCHIADLT